jgi:hypothetical protein
MRVKIITLLALAILIVASAACAMASDPVVTKQAHPNTYPPSVEGFFAYPAYGSSDTSDISQISDLVKHIVDLSADTYGSKACDQPSSDMIQNAFSNYRLSGIPEPVGLISAMAPAEPANRTLMNDTDSVKKALIGKNLTYTSFAGKPMNYTITDDSIKSITLTSYDGHPAWKVRVGEGMSWNLIVDGSGNILETKQLFYT